MEHMQELEAKVRGLKKVVVKWAKRKGLKGSDRMMEG